MPELPEVETIVRDLRERIVGRTVLETDVAHADVLAPDLSPAALVDALRGHRIEDVARRGKNIVLHVEGDRILAVNLGMTGRLVVGRDTDAGTPSEEATQRAASLQYVAVRFALDGDRTLYYDDVRRFGRLDLYTPEGWAERDEELGIEPLSDEFSGERLHALTQRSRTPIRNWLLDQYRVAGIGNIYANEALFRAHVRPDRPANSLTAEEAARLRDAIRAVLAEAVEQRGTTFRDYRDASGDAGGFEPRLNVYGREDEPCPVCEAPIERLVLSNRSAFLCPVCQG